MVNKIMKDLRVSDGDLLLLMDALNLYESACVFTHNSSFDTSVLKDMREKIRVAYNDF